jgi:hypothetical protein
MAQAVMTAADVRKLSGLNIGQKTISDFPLSFLANVVMVLAVSHELLFLHLC